MPFFREEGKEKYLWLLCEKQKLAREVVNIKCRIINEATEFRKLFSRDKNLEM